MLEAAWAGRGRLKTVPVAGLPYAIGWPSGFRSFPAARGRRVSALLTFSAATMIADSRYKFINRKNPATQQHASVVVQSNRR